MCMCVCAGEAINNDMGPTHCRATPAFSQSASEEEEITLNLEHTQVRSRRERFCIIRLCRIKRKKGYHSACTRASGLLVRICSSSMWSDVSYDIKGGVHCVLNPALRPWPDSSRVGCDLSFTTRLAPIKYLHWPADFLPRALSGKTRQGA